MATDASAATFRRSPEGKKHRPSDQEGLAHVITGEFHGNEPPACARGAEATGVMPDSAGSENELSALAELLREARTEIARLKEEVETIAAERDAARSEAAAHADTTRSVSAVMEKLVDGLRRELESVSAAATAGERDLGTPSADLLATLEERDALLARLADIEASRAWAVVTRYCGVRVRLRPRR